MVWSGRCVVAIQLGCPSDSPTRSRTRGRSHRWVRPGTGARAPPPRPRPGCAWAWDREGTRPFDLHRTPTWNRQSSALSRPSAGRRRSFTRLSVTRAPSPIGRHVDSMDGGALVDGDRPPAPCALGRLDDDGVVPQQLQRIPAPGSRAGGAIAGGRDLDRDVLPDGSDEAETQGAGKLLGRQRDRILGRLLAAVLTGRLVDDVVRETGLDVGLAREEDSREVALVGRLVEGLLGPVQRTDELLAQVVDDRVAVVRRRRDGLGRHVCHPPFAVPSPPATVTMCSPTRARVMPTYSRELGCGVALGKMHVGEDHEGAFQAP